MLELHGENLSHSADAIRESIKDILKCTFLNEPSKWAFEKVDT